MSEVIHEQRDGVCIGREQVHHGTHHVVSYCECGFEFITHSQLREAGR